MHPRPPRALPRAGNGPRTCVRRAGSCRPGRGRPSKDSDCLEHDPIVMHSYCGGGGAERHPHGVGNRQRQHREGGPTASRPTSRRRRRTARRSGSVQEAGPVPVEEPAGRHRAYDVSAETFCAEIHKLLPLPRWAYAPATRAVPGAGRAGVPGLTRVRHLSPARDHGIEAVVSAVMMGAVPASAANTSRYASVRARIRSTGHPPACRNRCCTAGPVHSLTVAADEGMTVHAGS
jgi:hypothetical protein